MIEGTARKSSKAEQNLGFRCARIFTTDAIAGILVVLITVLIVNQALGIRREREQFRATAMPSG